MASKNSFSISTEKTYDSLPDDYQETVTITSLKFFADGNVKKEFNNISLSDPTSSGNWSVDLSGYDVPLVGSSGVISADVEYKSPGFSFIQSAVTSSSSSLSCDSSTLSAGITVSSVGIDNISYSVDFYPSIISSTDTSGFFVWSQRVADISGAEEYTGTIQSISGSTWTVGTPTTSAGSSVFVSVYGADKYGYSSASVLDISAGFIESIPLLPYYDIDSVGTTPYQWSTQGTFYDYSTWIIFRLKSDDIVDGHVYRIETTDVDSINVDTFLASYDTYLPTNPDTEMPGDSNDDIDVGVYQSAVSLVVASGNDYYFAVRPYYEGITEQRFGIKWTDLGPPG